MANVGLDNVRIVISAAGQGAVDGPQQKGNGHVDERFFCCVDKFSSGDGGRVE